METILTLIRRATLMAATGGSPWSLRRAGLGALVPMCVFALSSMASPIANVMNGVQYGTVDFANGVLHQIGPDLPEGSEGLAAGPNGLKVAHAAMMAPRKSVAASAICLLVVITVANVQDRGGSAHPAGNFGNAIPAVACDLGRWHLCR